jgi:uncharacterized membrane protein HdeD (DUF308 family)
MWRQQRKYIFGSIVIAFPVSTAVFVIIMVGIGLLFAGISHVVNGLGNKESPGWTRGFSIGKKIGALAIALSFLVMVSPYDGACKGVDKDFKRSWSAAPPPFSMCICG